jgi:hypothetical protein
MKSVFNIENKFFIFKNVISKEFANLIIDFTKNKIVEDIKINYTDDVKEFTNCIEIDVAPKHDFRNIINTNILEYIKSIYKNDIDEIKSKQSGIIFYKENHYMTIHRDGGVMDNPRICTSVLNLNNKTENGIGGDVICYDENENIIHTYTPETGDLIIFDSFYNKHEKSLLHSVNAIQNWERFVYRTYWEK